MPTVDESAPTQERVELQTWYLDSLRPKLIRAAGAGVVERAAANELDQQLRNLFDLPDVYVEVAL